MNKIQALNNFWNSFNLSAYDEGSVPDDAKLPYITYTVGENDFGYPVSLTASIWYRSKKWDDISLKSEEIAERIGLGGVMIPYDDGAFWLTKGNPFSMRVRDEDDSIRRIFMNIEVEFIN